MKDVRKGVLGGLSRQTTTDISKAQTQRTRDQILENLLVSEVKGSGNGPIHKGDKCVVQNILVEEKATTKGSIRIELGVIAKICEEALEAGGKVPALIYSFVGPQKTLRHVYRDWALIPLPHVPWLRIAGREDV